MGDPKIAADPQGDPLAYKRSDDLLPEKFMGVGN